MLSNIGTTEILIIAVIILIFFGGKKLPELARGLGDAMKEFKSASGDGEKKKDNKEE